MLKKLRIRFVAVIMVIVTAMLCLVFGMLYSITQQSLESESIRMMQAIAANPFQLARPNDASQGLRLPYFMLQIGSQGELVAAGGGYYDLSDEEFLKSLLEAVRETGGHTGIIREYNLRFYSVGTPMGQRIIFSDITSERSTLRNLAKSCLGLGLVCFFIFLGISVALSVWMVKPVDKAWRQQRQFVADASHELKTPLTVIIANAEMLRSPEYDGENKTRLADNVLTMSRQMRDLVERLLDLARADNEGEKMALTPLDLSALVEKTLLPFEPLFFESGLTLSSQIQGGVTVRANAQRLRQVVEVLLDNAQKYASSPGTVTVRLEQTGRRCRLSVANPGEAISDGDLKNIFRRFYRVDKARSRDGGFGLGLSIAESIVLAHHGRIWAESKGGVNTFFVELPTATGHMEE